MVKIGYYPGDPMPRPPKGGRAGKYVPPAYDFDVLSEYINSLEYDIEGLPPFVKEQLAGDFKRSLTVSATPTRADYDVQLGLLYGDIEQTPGVNLRLNLDPRDWAEDPGKQATRTLEGWGKSIVNWDDIRNWAERKYFWEPIISGRDELVPKTQAFEGLYHQTEEFARELMELPGPTAGKAGQTLKPFQLDGIGITAPAFYIDEYPLADVEAAIAQGQPPKTRTVGNIPGGPEDGSFKGKVDVYSRAGQDFLSLADKVEAMGPRNGAYNQFRGSALYAVKTELNDTLGYKTEDYIHPQHGAVITVGDVIPDAIDPTDKLSAIPVFQALDLSKVTNPEMARELRNFNAAADIANSMLQFRAGPTSQAGLALASKNLSKLLLEGDKAAISVPESFDLVLLNGNDVLKGLESTVAQEKTRLEAILQGLPTGADRTAFRNSNIVQSYGRLLDRTRDIARTYKGEDLSGSTLASKTVLGKLKSEIETMSDEMSRSGYFKKGLEHDWLEQVVNRGILDNKSMFAGQGSFGELLEHAVGLAASDPNRASGITNIKRVLRTGNRMYDRNDVNDLVMQIEKGTLIQSQIWPLIKVRLNGFTPAYVTEQFLKKNQYFGLAYDPAYLEANLRQKGAFGAPVTGGGVKVDPSTLKANYRGDLTGRTFFTRIMPRNSWNITLEQGGVKNKVKLYGGKHFKAVETINKQFHFDKEVAGFAKGAAGLLGAELDPRTGHLLGFRDGGASLFAILNGGDPGIEFILTKFQTKAPGVKELRHDMMRFRAWLYLHKDELGLKFDGFKLADSPENVQIMTQFFQQMGKRLRSPDFISITWERAGYLQHLSSYANQIQTKIAQKVGKYAAPYIQLKNALSNAITELIIQATAAATAGAGELMELLRPVIKFLVNAVISKIEGLIKSFFKNILKGEFSVADWAKTMDKFVGNTARAAGLFALIPGVFFLIAFMLFAVIITGLNPLDPSRTGGFAGSKDTFGEGTPGTYDGCSADTYVGEGSGGSSVPGDCFVFEGASSSHYAGTYSGTLIDWSVANLAAFNTAIEVLGERTGGYVDRLCSAGPVYLLRTGTSPGWCGNVIDADTIVFTSLCTYSVQNYVNYLFAHETGHVYRNRLGSDNLTGVIAAEGTFPTYPGNCGSNNSLSEDFSETVGNWVHVNACDCPGVAAYGGDWTTWWDSFPEHKAWAESFFD
ncbi:MAG: hypothetical protein UU77_C0006G0011 [candidate division WWE3 bacterium GW2011_GWC1_41_7]|uniref:Uncharacterized protein n=1 Tax=candidate division WWE3 bacterium GW2011_GWC1_41_7 TaxID=1619119 RepID=A0A0G0X851_UNCKA|nr:MAG: hypothetical protein UU77_C0006G0011 [candidate division WWE3 bacterium GW2011_GWC1_41_7]